MKKLAGTNITRTAFWVALLSIVPAMAIIAVTAVTRYHDEVELSRLRGERLVRLIAERQVHVTEVVGTLAQVLVDLKRVRNADTATTTALFDTLANNSPEYSNIFLLRGDGSVIASGLPMPAGMNFSQFVFFKRVLRRKAFSVGTVKDSLFDKKSILYFGAPVAFAGGGVGVLGISLNLTRYDDTLAGLPLRKDAAVYLLDGTGALTASSSHPQGVAPGGMLGGDLWRGVQEQAGDAGSFFIANASEQGRLRVTYRKLFMPDTDMPYFYVLYVRPEASSYAGARALMQQDIALAAMVILLSVFIAVVLYFYTVGRPWRALYETAMRMSTGDLAARVPEKGVGGEIGLLGREFNAMAGVLEKRDAELSAARDYAERSRKAKSEFLANMSHEVRTSMNAILGMAYLVLKTDLSAQQKGYVSKLLSAANALLRIINDILDFSKMEAGKMAVETISLSLRRILGNLRSECTARLAEKHLGFTLSIAPDVPAHLMGDPLRLSQALFMLVDDAVNRSERGDISLACTVAARDGANVTVAFEVRDAGVGLTPVQLADLRELFAGSDDAAISMMDKQRLRLAIAGRLFRLMGGGITLESTFGKGVSFTATCALTCGEGDLRRHDRFFGNARALVIDPGVLSGQDLAEILERFGVAATCVPDLGAARDALLAAEKEGRSYSVIFADWRPSMPDFPEEVQRVKNGEGLTAAPRVVLTMPAGRAELPVSPDEVDVDALLPKPVNDSLMFDTLVTVLGGRAESEAEPHAPDRNMAGDLAGLRVLLVEDNKVNQQIAQELMTEEGVTATIAGNGAEAVALATEGGAGRWDLVLMDLQMPKMDGLAATRALRALEGFDCMRLPIIAMTAHSDINEITACFDAGMNDHTGKPIIVETFFATLWRWLPVRPEDAGRLAAGVARLRAALADGSASETEAALDALVPVLGEGRATFLRAALIKEGPPATQSLLDALDALAKGLLSQEGAAPC